MVIREFFRKAFFLKMEPTINIMSINKAKKLILQAIQEDNYENFLKSIEVFKNLALSIDDRSWYIENTYVKMAPHFIKHNADIAEQMRLSFTFFKNMLPISHYYFHLLTQENLNKQEISIKPQNLI